MAEKGSPAPVTATGPLAPAATAAKLNIMDFLDSLIPPQPVSSSKSLYPSQLYMQRDEQEKYLLSLLTFGLDRLLRVCFDLL